MAQQHSKPSGHEKIETSNFLMIVLILLVLLVARIEERAGHVDPLLQGSWLLRPYRALTSLISLVELPGRDRDRGGPR